MVFPKPGQTSRRDHGASSRQETQASSMPLLPSRKRETINDMPDMQARKRETINDMPDMQARKRGTINYMQAREETDDAIAQLFFAHGLPFHIASSPYFKEAINKVSKAGPSYAGPEEHKLRTSLLEKQYSRCSLLMKQMRDTWLNKGCSIIMDGWTNIRQRPLINIIVTCSAGPYFLRAIDCSGKRKDAEYQYLLLKEAIEEVGPSNVVQVITDATLVCQQAGQMIEHSYRHIFWTPCCVHALNNALKDIGRIDWVRAMVAEARDLQMFICNHHTSLALFRSFSKKEFVKPGDTRYATYFILLERMIEVEDALQTMVVCTEWKRWPESKTEEGKKIRDKILDESWWTQARYIVSFIAPIVAVIRNADTNAPSLGDIYEIFDSMLGEMKRIICARDPTLYETHISPIIQRRWDRMNTFLHMAAYAVNPKWYEPRLGRVPPYDDTKVRQGFLNALKKMYAREEGLILRDEWLIFVNLRGPCFSQQECREDRATIAQSTPHGWWQLYGNDTPKLRYFAIKLLSQVASSSVVERNWSTYNFIHSVRRNKLTSPRVEKLVAVHSFLRLRERVKPKYRQSPATRWDVDPEDVRQIDEDEDQEGLVGVPLDALHLDDEGSSSDADADSPVEGTLPHENF